MFSTDYSYLFYYDYTSLLMFIYVCLCLPCLLMFTCFPQLTRFYPRLPLFNVTYVHKSARVYICLHFFIFFYPSLPTFSYVYSCL